ncbi:hypothetical protein G7Z17_g8094 [Cylindrodendrum hubeiense]|uniref:SET domain-containing protein n=1 Tax=Cylindrodendrum hubeiense TaxID=595255 RepID=A0A9P5L6T9_9HYPO|nr:hypothetical protein G7Z17_g8094 [Cylindrodendrum hubeiense]
MGIDCGFDIYPPLERTDANKTRYELFLCEVLEAYGLHLDDRTNPTVVADSDNVVRVNAASECSYIEFMVGEHPRIPRRCQHFLRFSSKVSGRSVAEPHIRIVYKIARQHLGDRVYFWHESNEFGACILQRGCYNWNEIRAAERRIGELGSEENEEQRKPERKETNQNDPHQSSSVPDSDNELYAIQPIQSKGQGIIATSNIPRGTRILLEAPIFKLPDSMGDVDSAESIVLRQVRSLSREQQRAFFALQNVHGRRYSPLLGIVQTNMLPLAGNDSGNGGLFIKASRINHSCQPNAQQMWNSSLSSLTVHALDDIQTGDEITISYISGVSMGYIERQRYLMDGFSFFCACGLCSLPLSARLRNDERLAQIQSIEDNGDLVNPDEVSRRSTEVYRQVRQLFELLEEEGIRDMRLSNACFMAFQIAAIIGDKSRAKVFAEKAYSARKLLSGDDNPVTIAFKRFADRPVDHPLYGARMQCYDSNWEPPQHISEEEFEDWLWNTDGWLLSSD